MIISAPTYDATPADRLGASGLAEVFAAAGDPTRVEMLRILAASEEVACTTFERLFPISKSTISYHVKVLRQAGLIQVRKEGTFYHYTLRRGEIEQRLPGFVGLIAALGRPESLAGRQQ